MKLHVNGPRGTENYSKILAALDGSGIELVDRDHDFDFVLPQFDPITREAATISESKSKPFPDLGFITKSGLQGKCVASGLSTLPEVPLTIQNLLGCAFPHFIIKPDLWSGAKHTSPYVYRVFSSNEIALVVEMIGNDSTDGFVIQKALIDEATQETYLLFVDGAVNGLGEIYFNPIAEKWMLNSSSEDSHITHKVGIRDLSFDDKYNFKQKVIKLLQDNNIRNTPFKAQAIVDIENGECFVTDWSWGIMPYTHLNILPAEYLVAHLKYAYDVTPTMTKPIDVVIVMNHIAFPKEDWDLDAPEFDAKYSSLTSSLGIKRAETLRGRGSVKPLESNYYVLFGIACGSVQAGKEKLESFQSQISSV
jgi:hypothetical protein